MFAKIKALLKINSLKNEAFREVKMDNGVKPGWRTSQFWLTVLSQVPMIACTLKGHESVPCIVLAAVTTCIYTVGRTMGYKWAQNGPPKSK